MLNIYLATLPEFTLYPRYARIRLEEALADTPVVLLPSNDGCSARRILVFPLHRGEFTGYFYQSKKRQ